MQPGQVFCRPENPNIKIRNPKQAVEIPKLGEYRNQDVFSHFQKFWIARIVSDFDIRISDFPILAWPEARPR
jgi:hypothetical protein